MHVPHDVLLLAAYGRLPPARLLRALHAHLLELCPRSAFEWEVECDRRGGGQTLPFAGLGVTAEDLAPLPDDDDEIDLEAAEPPRRRYLAALREAERKSRRDLAILRRLAPDERERRVSEATTGFRFRSRALVELLVDEARRARRGSPGEAAVWARLALLVLRQVPATGGQPWLGPLALRAAEEWEEAASDAEAGAWATARGLAAVDRFRRAVAAGRADGERLDALVQPLRAPALPPTASPPSSTPRPRPGRPSRAGDRSRRGRGCA